MITKSLYIHIPFCRHICTYCDFPKVFYREKLADEYLNQLEKELSAIPERQMVTIYIGGGTPSALNDQQLSRLLSIVDPFVSEALEEYTIEVNPESMDQERLRLFKEHHVNRLSIGVESFDDRILSLIGRQHTSDQALSLINQAQALGFESLSIDLMYGLPSQSIEDIQRDLSMAVSLPIDHLSYYALILEEHTILHHQAYQPLDEDQEAAINDLINDTLEAAGFHLYEVSNYAKGNHESRHNKAYWLYENYYGAGVGATGKIDDVIYTHSRSIKQYNQGADIITRDVQTREETMFNHLMMSLRLVEGLNLKEFEKRYGQSIFDLYPAALKKHLTNGNLVLDGFYLKTTSQSLRYLNDILIDFL